MGVIGLMGLMSEPASTISERRPGATEGQAIVRGYCIGLRSESVVLEEGSHPDAEGLGDLMEF